ncbi:hypothetical protein M409DRAFT_18033 [Zasmidium cellare ATCC 36951]|uniref:DUF1682-domain-containing protein n=1 Tax=Zasmidium cellare ATCC 36951 TaxID=1080233 RepID=A0A6A6CZZ7_ZASCE|nr:uncharacterized protein M409DRAFT_18033 [Zasmidium cellare ATCC 36951]KAF2171800.1 hypothetical protein M409DRAFT_18033 [Zasmidium cellare ATCC 36951]
MAALALLKPLQDFLGGAKSDAPAAAAPSDDFADFATAASPQPPSHAASSAFPGASTTAKAAAGGLFSAGTGIAGRPYTKWYRVWERVTIADFYQELVIIPIIVVIIIVNIIGASLNKKRARQWAQTNLPLLESEFARVGYNNYTKEAIAKDPEKMYKQKSKNEYTTYATGRQNVAFVDVKLTLYKRYNPLILFGEAALSFFMDSIAPPVEKLEATAYCFDGKEKSLVPAKTQAVASPAPASKDSTFDGFVWAVVHKDKMKQLRDDRYDLSLTSTKDHPKLPQWATVMSESAEITEAMLTPELLKALNEAGEDLEALVISDQPIDAPKKLNDIVSKKRVYLSTRLNNSSNSSALFTYFLRLPDHLVNSAHFRSEALRKIKATREEEMRKLRKIDEDEKAEERRTQSEKLKKEERDRKLSKMSADEQKKFLEKEKEKSQRKGMKKQTMRG